MRKPLLRYVVGGALALGLTLAAGAQARRPAQPNDVYRLLAVSSPVLSPDGNTVAYVVTRMDRAHDRRVEAIWEVAADGAAAPKPFIADISAHAPAWSPDGRWLAFLSNGQAVDAAHPAAAKTQVWVEAADGSHRHAVTRLPNGISDFRWSPNGSQFAVVSSNQPAHLPDFLDTISIFYKFDGHGYLHGQHHIWLVDRSSGAARVLTQGETTSDSDPQWSPDGSSIAYVCRQVGPALRSVGGGTSVKVIPAAGGAPVTVGATTSNVSLPRWSPDGHWLAYAASPTPPEQPRLWLWPAAGGTPVIATAMDLFPTQIVWDHTGALWFAAHDRGTLPFFRVDVSHHTTVEVLSGNRAYHDLQVTPDGRRLVFVIDDSTHPADLYTSARDGSGQRQLTHSNEALLAQLKLAPTQAVTWKSSADGVSIQGFLTKPFGWQPGHRYPMILIIHGGPNGMFGYHFSWDEQLYAAHGYAVLRTNPRGSSGYGMRFQRQVAQQWGGTAYEDIMSGVHAMLAHYSWINPQQLGVAGHSFGGFMTDWLVTQTHIFKAAVSIAGISDFISVESTRDAAYGHTRDFGGDLYQNFPLYWKDSAVRLAAQVTTPILFLHGEMDERVPDSQSEEYFRAIKHFGGTAELVLFPGESHMLPVSGRPRHLVETYAWRLYWFDRYVEANTSAIKPGGQAARWAAAAAGKKGSN